METKFTLGPWNCTRSSAGGREIITSDVLPVDICVLSHRDKTPAEINANALLIAAAPDLYAALAELEESSDYDIFVPSGIADRIKAALAKARGEVIEELTK